MRLAFISDLHGNIQALTTVKRFLAEQIVNQVIVVGDLVGYGASPGPVIDFVRREGWVTGLGSSDMRVALELGERAERHGVADQVLGWTRKVLSPDQLEFLRRLPPGGRLMTPVGRVRFFHGSPHAPDQRLDLMAPERELEELAEMLGARVVVVGGSHVPFVRTVGDTTFVDPGSVGLSLNHEPGADVAVVDCVGRKPRVTLHKVSYDYASSAFDIMAWNLPPVIADVIRTGKMG
ncbi:metallophosphoesterase [Deinococcus metallilatus]|uniref:Metallophosphoesterase family protein n=1 Tax=Deinococcus metallilatus TaxID=1211322 RepID=A0AAJ5F4X4_9DEIO|nr:metallophosphoesterase family protein [Deinococcus metallilatus]MBB5294115.1 putative phosphodiesterase [Deinococcus metallilatus]QBY08900.1 metallophosphoesterase [Deinococcus metallilatus]RXJ10044.1 metallophosphoesterase [Deinococcus metallilatus]TLK28019.1 metallophosphoesterase family protein [Deinococcus metallilatus]GMA16549.1 metallophosphoesterase [Deinococcus metallilatus]